MMEIEGTSSEPFTGPRLKIERAKQHTQSYRTAFGSFRNSHGARILLTKSNAVGVRFEKPLPGDLRLCAADAIYNLRSALDQAVCCATNLAGRSSKGVYFPHGQSRANFEASLKKQCKNVPEPVRMALTALEPYYQGSGYRYRVLHDLNIVDKHAELIAISPRVRSLYITRLGQPELKPSADDRWYRDIDKFEVIERDLPGTGGHSVKVTLTITFVDAKAVQNKSVTQVLNELCASTAAAVDAIEAAASR